MVDFPLLSLAFGAGLITFFSPCAYAMLPAYITYHLSRRETKSGSVYRSYLEGAKVGGAMSLGFMLFLLAVGTIVSFAGVQIGQYLSHAAIVVGVILIVLGVLWLAKVRLSFLVSLRVPIRNGWLSFFAFGIAYAIGSATCALPVFLLVVFAAVISGGIISGLSIFLLYSLGMIVVMIPLSIAVSTSKDLILQRFERILPHVRKIGAVTMIIAGIYLISIQVFVL